MQKNVLHFLWKHVLMERYFNRVSLEKDMASKTEIDRHTSSVQAYVPLKVGLHLQIDCLFPWHLHKLSSTQLPVDLDCSL